MDRLITNIQSGPPKDTAHRSSAGSLSTRIAVESTVQAAPRIWTRRSGRGLVLVLDFDSVRLNMPDCDIPVVDGLIDHIEAHATERGSIIEAHLEHDVPFSTSTSDGIPHRLEIWFDMTAVYRVLSGRTLIIDPGHGGGDTGGRGPVNLLEKDVVLDLARRLKSTAKRAGMRCTMTRNGDVFVSEEARLELAARAIQHSVFVSLHTGVAPDPAVRGAAAAFAGPGGEDLAGLVLSEITRKLHLPLRGLRPAAYATRPRIPAVAVEFVTITNPVDEGLVRSYVFMDRAALAILNAVKNLFWRLEPGD